MADGGRHGDSRRYVRGGNVPLAGTRRTPVPAGSSHPRREEPVGHGHRGARTGHDGRAAHPKNGGRFGRRHSADRTRIAVALTAALAAGGMLIYDQAALGSARDAQAAAEQSAADAEAALEQAREAQVVEDATDGGWTLHASKAFSSSDAWSSMKDAVDDFVATDDGYECGIVIKNLQSGEEASYDEDRFFYPASSIKALYLCALFQEEVESGQAALSAVQRYVEPILVYSDNDAYDGLWQAYGPQPFIDWARDAGVDDEFLDNAAEHTYPRVSARDMALLWEHAYGYLSGGSKAARILAECLDEPETTAIGTVAEKGGRSSWSKAGWFPDSSGNADPATADCGIVFDDSGAYLVCVLTSAPQDFDALTTLIAALDDAEPALA